MELFLDVTRAARLFSISRTSIRALIRRGRLRSYRLGPKGKHLIKPVDLERVIVGRASNRKQQTRLSRQGFGAITAKTGRGRGRSVGAPGAGR